MKHDQKVVNSILTKMFSTVDTEGKYATEEAILQLDKYIDGVRESAINWTHHEVLNMVRAGWDPSA